MEGIILNIESWLQKVLGLSPVLQQRVFTSFAVVLGIILLRKLFLTLLFSLSKHRPSHYYWRRNTWWLAFVLAMLLVGRIWFNFVDSLLTYIGILSAGIAIALQNPLSNIAAWLYIIIRKPFVLGDRIQLGSDAGDVIDISLFQFTINEIGNWIDGDQSSGRIIHIPNGRLWSEPLANYTMGFYYIWHEISLTLTYQSNWRKAKSIIEEIVNEKSKPLVADAERLYRQSSSKYLILYSKFTPLVYVRGRDNGILFTIRTICDPRSRRSLEQSIWEEILTAFEQHSDIQYAYQSTRLLIPQEPTAADPEQSAFFSKNHKKNE